MTSDSDHPRYRPLFPIPAAVLIAVSLLVLMLLLIDGRPAPSTSTVAHLPHTDGAERLASAVCRRNAEPGTLPGRPARL
jgi:hypothetical protein